MSKISSIFEIRSHYSKFLIAVINVARLYLIIFFGIAITSNFIQKNFNVRDDSTYIFQHCFYTKFNAFLKSAPSENSKCDVPQKNMYTLKVHIFNSEPNTDYVH